MKRNVLALLLTLIASCGWAGEIVHDTLFSSTLNVRRAVNVYIPDGYRTGTDNYPVIYFLHGMGEDENSYNLMSMVLDGLIANHSMVPTLVAIPDGSCAPYFGSLYTNSALYGNFEDYISQDVVNYIDSHYRTRPYRTQRSIMGHSMGGYGAMKMALKHPDEYCAVVSLSGFLSINPFEFWRNQVLVENNSHGPYNPEAGWFTGATYSTAGAFSPNMSNPPYYVDLPLTNAGDVIPEVQQLWSTFMPAYLARHDSSVRNVFIYFDCGEQDELGFFPMNQDFDSSLDSLQIPHVFISFQGDHTNRLLTRGTLAFMVLDSVMRLLPIEETPQPAAPLTFSLLQAYPNPFNSQTRIAFDLSRSSPVKLDLFDLSGRLVRTLADQSFPGGHHELALDASSLPSGTYFVRMQSVQGIRAAKILLLK